MKVVIMQPTWLPWMGYFDLIDQADKFVFLDTVQFEKQSWQQRNRVVTAKGLEWITVPVLIKGRFGQAIREVEIDSRKFPTKQLRMIRQNYSRSPFMKEYFDAFEQQVQEAAGGGLCELNIAVINWISEQLGIQADFIRASDLGSHGKRGELLVNILRELAATEYLSPMGSRDYLVQDRGYFAESEMPIVFQNYQPPIYDQLRPPFVGGASVIDLLFNEGARSLEIIRSGRDQSIPASEIMG